MRKMVKTLMLVKNIFKSLSFFMFHGVLQDVCLSDKKNNETLGHNKSIATKTCATFFTTIFTTMESYLSEEHGEQFYIFH